MPKVPTKFARSITLQAFCPPPFQTSDQEKLNFLCPVRELDAYVHKASLWIKSDQLFVCFGWPRKGSPATKQIMSKWIVENISLAYEAFQKLTLFGSGSIYRASWLVSRYIIVYIISNFESLIRLYSHSVCLFTGLTTAF